MSNSDLDNLLEKAKVAVFRDSNSGFLAPVLCSMHFSWNEKIPTAMVKGTKMQINPDFFLGLDPATRGTVLLHEVKHVAYLHAVRGINKKPKLWNIAADHYINLELESEGSSFRGIEWAYKDYKYRGWVEEDIYADLVSSGHPEINDMAYDLDEDSDDDQDIQDTINAVIQAKHVVKASGKGNIPGEVESFITDFLKPVIPWQTLLSKFCTDLVKTDYSWARPNRRYSNMYLPSLVQDEAMLGNLTIYQDTSGSVTDEEIRRFNSEVKFIIDRMQPTQVTLVQFDWEIRKVDIIQRGEPFTGISVIGRGGTSFAAVRDHILATKPTAAIIFSDMETDPMNTTGINIPLLWVAVGNYPATVQSGTLIRIPREKL